MRTIQQSFSVAYSFPVIFTRDAFGPENTALVDVLRGAEARKRRVLAVIDSNVGTAVPTLLEKISRYAKQHSDIIDLVVPPLMVRGGEVCKNEPREVELIHALVEKQGLCRHSSILAIGGGAVLDMAGFAAATAHRGVRLIRMPTTTLAQNDAGIGVKNGINAFGRKNFTGSFAPPFAVINDFDFLKSLPDREKRAGISEAIKVALIKDRAFFDFLYASRAALRVFEPKAMETMIIRCAELHMEHIGRSGDPFEFGSSRPLDFGHWAAHKLEELTSGEIRHGEAVAIGIALDSLYSYQQKLISELELHRILTVMEDLGFDLYHLALSWLDISKALQEFREHLGGLLSIPLLSGIGDKIEVNHIDENGYKECVGILASRAKRNERNHERANKSIIDQGNSRYLLS